MRGGWSSPTPYTPMDGENKAITTKKKKCVQSLGKVSIKKNDNFWSYRLHKLGTLKCCGRTDRWTDGLSGPTTRTTFAKARQVTKRFTFLLDAPPPPSPQSSFDSVQQVFREKMSFEELPACRVNSLPPGKELWINKVMTN